MIRDIDHRDIEMARRILEIQTYSYPIEANIIGVDKLPPMQETVSDIQCTEESFIGFEENSILVGFIAYETNDEWMTISRLAVYPDFFEQGIASTLLNKVIDINEKRSMEVMTGMKNEPAIQLYNKFGFKLEGQLETKEGIQLVRLVKKA